MKFTFNKGYFIFFCLLFLTEIGIALFISDSWIRPYFGDFLVVILLYCFFKSFIQVSANTCLTYVLIISFAVETLQYFNFVKIIGLADVRAANIMFGNYFSWIDMLMYTLGIAFAYMVEAWRADIKVYSIRPKKSEG